MQIKDYLDEILNLIAENPFILSQSLSFEERPPDSAFISGSISFIDGSRLHLKEFVIFEPKGVIILKYGYNYLTSNETMIFRYDNALDPQVKKLPTYPEHKHTSKGLLPEPRPPLPLQQEFAKLVEDIEAEKARQAESGKKIDELFDSLMHRAFTGELAA